MKQYFIPFDPGWKKPKYNYILYLYLIAEYDTESKLYNTIHYKSLDELAARINEKAGGESRVSKATLSRFLNDPEKTTFFEIDKDRKVIILKNDFKRKNKEEESRPFVILTEREFDFLIVQNQDLLTTYFLYLRYYCGHSKSKEIDTTAKQFLAAWGYSTKSGNYLSKISEYNTLLSSNTFLKIRKERVGKEERNYYSF